LLSFGITILISVVIFFVSIGILGDALHLQRKEIVPELISYSGGKLLVEKVSLQGPLNEQSLAALEEFEHDLRGFPEVILIYLFDAEGRLIWESDSGSAEVVDHDPHEILEALKKGVIFEKLEHEKALALGVEDAVEIYSPLFHEDGRPFGVVNVYFDESSTLMVMGWLRHTLGIIMLLIVVISAGLQYLRYIIENKLSLRQTKSLERYSRGLEHKVDEEAEKLARINSIFESITRAATDAIIVINNEGIVTIWNSAAERLFGYAPNEAIGKLRLTKLMPERKRAKYLEQFDLFKKTGKGKFTGRTEEFIAVRKDGEEFDVEIALSGVRIDDEWHAIVILRDITAKKLQIKKIGRRNY